MADVVIVDSGVANLASITSGFCRLGASVAVTRDPAAVRQAPRVVLPGVGAFGAGLGALRAHGLDSAITDVAARGTPLLGICLGMQMLCEASDETPGVPGLGVIAGVCRRLPDDVRVPHLGWNAVTAESNGGLIATGVAAFANSYALRDAPAGWTAGWTTHGVRFVAALERDGVLVCQFHPELSGAYGAGLLQRWITGARATQPTPAAGPAPGLLPRVMPCLDVKDGRVVKGVRFQDLRDAGDPATQGAAYEAQGADEIVVLDVAASAEARPGSRGRGRVGARGRRVGSGRDSAHELGSRRHARRSRCGAAAGRRGSRARAGDRLGRHRRARPRCASVRRWRGRGARGVGVPRRRRHRRRHQGRALAARATGAAMIV